MENSKTAEKNLILIKRALIQIFNKVAVDEIDFESLKTTEDTLTMFVPFIQGVYYEFSDRDTAVSYLKSFISTIRERFGLIVDEYTDFSPAQCESFEEDLTKLLQIYEKATEKLERQDILFLHKNIANFKHIEYIDWENKETIEDIIKYAVSKTIFLLYSKAREDKIEDIHRKVETKAFLLKSCGHKEAISLNSNLNKLVSSEEIKRAEFLKRRIEPTLGLDEYANMIMAAMKQKEIEKIEKQENIFDENEFKNEEEERQKKIIKDTKKEEFSSFLGKTKRQG